LRREFTPYLKDLVEASYSVSGLHTYGGSEVCGNVDVHASALAGRNARGELGFVVQEYSLRDGEIVYRLVFEYFGDDRRIWARPGKPVVRLAQEPGTWTDSPLAVVRRFLSTLKAADDRIGGPDQIVELTLRGAQRSQLPAGIVSTNINQISRFDHATVQVGGGGFTFSGSGGITIAGGGDISVSPGSIFGTAVKAGTAGFYIFNTQVIDSNGNFVGGAVNVPGGCGANGFNPKVGGVQHYGANLTFRDLDGVTHQVVGGVIVS